MTTSSRTDNAKKSPAAPRTTMNTRRDKRLSLLGSAALLVATVAIGCGPDFDPGSLIEKTRVLGARVTVAGAPDRAAPAPGETATVTWLMTSPAATTPPLGWAFALCAPNALGNLSCNQAPLDLYQGSEYPPRVTFTVPGLDVLGTAKSLILYGRICVSSEPTFNPQSGLPGCTDMGDGTTAAVSIKLEDTDYPNHNPVADHGFTFDGQPWAADASGDPCAAGPRVKAGTEEHVITLVSAGADRESYTALGGYPAVPTALREALQISEFTTAGKLKTGISFVEAADSAPQTTSEVKWTTPKPEDVTAEQAVTFTFVVRDDRGGVDWTTRSVCVTP